MNQPRTITTDQRDAILKRPHFRLASVDREAVNPEKRTVEYVFASGAPVERWWGIEVLDMNPSSVRMGRWQNSPPFMENHRVRRGVIENGAIIDSKLRGTARLSRNPDAERLLQDITDGIAPHASVGYMVHEMIEMKPEEMSEALKQMCLAAGVKAFRCIIEPFEGSSVDIPADVTVGVDGSRSLEFYDPMDISDPEKLLKEIRSFKLPADNQPPPSEQVGAGQRTPINPGGRIMDNEKPVPTPEEILKTERERVDGLETIAKKFLGRIAKIDELKTQAVKDGWTTERFKGEIADRVADGQAVMTPESQLGLGEREVQGFSLLRLIQSQLTDGKVKAEFERECAAEIVKRSNKQWHGMPIPWEIQNRSLSVPIRSRGELEQLRTIALQSGLIHAARALDSTTATGAAELVGTILRADMFIDLLRNRSVAGQVGVQLITGIVGNITFPRQTAAGTWEWTGEAGTTTGSALTTGSIALTPKEGRAFQEYTRMLLLQSTPSIELLVQNDLLAIARLGIDKAVFHGTNANGQPKGIINETGIGAVNGANLGWAGVVDFETQVATANADIGSMFYVTNPSVRGILKTRQKALNQAVYLMDERGMVNGYNSVISNQIAAAHLFHGDFSQEILVYFGNLDLLVNPYAKDKEGITRVNIFADVDCRLRQVGAIAASSTVS